MIKLLKKLFCGERGPIPWPNHGDERLNLYKQWIKEHTKDGAFDCRDEFEVVIYLDPHSYEEVASFSEFKPDGKTRGFLCLFERNIRVESNSAYNSHTWKLKYERILTEPYLRKILFNYALAGEFDEGCEQALVVSFEDFEKIEKFKEFREYRNTYKYCGMDILVQPNSKQKSGYIRLTTLTK